MSSSSSSKTKSKSKTFLASYQEGFVELPYSQSFEFDGYTFVIHHRNKCKKGWHVSEISSGLRITNVVFDTRDTARDAALKILEANIEKVPEAVEKGVARKKEALDGDGK